MSFADENRAVKIEDAFAAQDRKNYQILVHALKSTALSIGATGLSEQAKSLEFAAKDNDIEKIQANHGDLMTTYKKIRDEISRWMEMSA